MGSPFGRLELVEQGDAVVAVHFGAPADGSPGHERGGSTVLAEARRQLGEYFDGRRRAFDLPLRPAGTAFQRRVWEVLATVPWGTTTTYGAIAARLGMPPGASRAVGAANGRNPISIVAPCHRVIGTNGTLVGYAGGLHNKRWLLEHEARQTNGLQTLF